MLSSRLKASSSDTGLTSDATCDIMTVPNRVGDHDALGVGAASVSAYLRLFVFRIGKISHQQCYGHK